MGGLVFFVCTHDFNRQCDYTDNHHTESEKLRICHHVYITPFAGGKLTPLGFLRWGSRLYVCIECTLTNYIIIHNSTRVKPGRKIFPGADTAVLFLCAIFFTNFRETIDIRRESAV